MKERFLFGIMEQQFCGVGCQTRFYVYHTYFSCVVLLCFISKERFLSLQEESIADVNEMMKQERPYPERRLRGVLEELASACSKYGTLTQGKSGGGASAGRTRLDKERVKLCQREVVSIAIVHFISL